MIKLYRSDSGIVEYWETWPVEERPRAAVLHEGRLGEPGTSVEVACGDDFAAWAARQAEEKQQSGFRPLSDEEHDFLLIKWSAAVLPDPRAIEPVWDELELLVNDALGWSGLGRCLGMDYSGPSADQADWEMTAMALAVDAATAIPVLVRALSEAGRAAGAVIAVRDDERDVIQWPADKAGSALDPGLV
jgi:hypothetical protein